MINYFNFKPFKDKVLITNDMGKHQFITHDELSNLVNKTPIDTELYMKNSYVDDEGVFVLEETSEEKEIKETKGELVIEYI